MREVDYQDFSLKLHNKASGEKNRIPVNATLELTYRCTNRCVHCFCNLPAGDGEAEKNELTIDEIEGLFDDLQRMGCLWLLITGGDPLVRKDFRDIYLSAKRHGFITSVFTNGVIIDDAIADLFHKYPPFTVEITMYGATAGTYEEVTRVSGSYERYRQGLMRLVDRGVKLKLKTMALTINRHEMHELERIAGELNCHFRFDPLLHKRIDENDYSDPVRYRISPEDVVRLDMEFPERMEAHEEFCERMVGEPVRSDKLITCGAGRSSLHIMPDGTVLPCSMLINRGFSLRLHPLDEIWFSLIPTVLAERRDFHIICEDCGLRNLCGQCPGWSYIEHGRVDLEVPYLCRIAHKRAESFPFLDEKKQGRIK